MSETCVSNRELEVTFGDFHALARRRGWTKEFLVERFREHLNDPPRRPRAAYEFFEAVWQGQYAATVIPFRSVLAFYKQELGLLQLASGTDRRCHCGCGARVFDRKVFASSACRKRGQRARQDVAA
jgi:hypothetical protein